MKLIKFLGVGMLLISMSSCSTRLVDFTVISTKNTNMIVDRENAKRTEGKATYFLGIGFNLKDGIDDAIQNAGTEYDMLVDGVVRYKNLPFVTIIEVEGLAVSSRSIQTSMTDEEFEQWCSTHDIMDREGNSLTYEDLKE